MMVVMMMQCNGVSFFFFSHSDCVTDNISALAVIAEREDLIARIFGRDMGASLNNPYGIVQVNLFLDR